jgi:hypothetical protein
LGRFGRVLARYLLSLGARGNAMSVMRGVVIAAVLVGLALCGTAPAMADNIHLCDVSQLSGCNSGSVIRIGSGTTQANVFGTAAPTGSTEYLYLAVLTPLTSGSETFNGSTASSTNLWTALGVQPIHTDLTFSSAASQESGATGIVAGSFSVLPVPGD